MFIYYMFIDFVLLFNMVAKEQIRTIPIRPMNWSTVWDMIVIDLINFKEGKLINDGNRCKTQLEFGEIPYWTIESKRQMNVISVDQLMEPT